jgi:hypothetical protein
MAERGKALLTREGRRLMVACAGVLLAITMQAATGAGQTVYRWTDERGGLHFTQSPPPPGVQYEDRRMPAARPAPTEAPVQAAAGEDVTPAGTPTPKLEGAARVELVRESARQMEPSVRLFKGTVRNAGRAEATDVVVNITVTETQQGAECLRVEVDVTPSSLPPGAEGTFEVELDNPCFFGDVSVKMEPDWD